MGQLTEAEVQIQIIETRASHSCSTCAGGTPATCDNCLITADKFWWKEQDANTPD